MKLRTLAFSIVVMLLAAGCAVNKPQKVTENAAVPQEVPDKTEEHELSAPDRTEETLSTDEIVGTITDGKYHIESINTEKLRFRIPDEIDGAPVVSIEGYIFAVSSIESVTFPDSMEYIGEAMFNACNSLTDVKFGSGLKHMGSMAFNGCGALKTVTFPEGMETFDDVIFYNCENLKEVYVPASVTGFGENTPILDPKTCPHATVVTPAGSPAEKICKERGVPVRAE